MSLRRVRFGQRVAAVGGIVLLVSMFLDWYGTVFTDGPIGDFGGDAFESPGLAGAIADALLIAACAVAIGGAVLTAMSRSLGIPVAMNAMTTFAGGGAFLLVLGRMIFQPGRNDVITLELWIFVALFAAAAIVYGGWIAMRDEAPQEPTRGGETPQAAQTTAQTPARAAGSAQATAVQPVAGPVAPVHQAPPAGGPGLATPAGAAYSAAQTSKTNSETRQGAKTKMDAGKLKPGHWVAGIGGIVLLLSLVFFNWYSFGGAVGDALESLGGLTGRDTSVDIGAWDGQGFFGTIANLIILACAGGAIALVTMTMTGSGPKLPTAASTSTAGLGAIAAVMIGLRMLFQPGEGEFVDLAWGIYVAFLAAIAIAVGGYLSMKEEGATFDQARDQMRDAAKGAGTPGQPPQQPPPGGQPPPQPPSQQPPQT